MRNLKSKIINRQSRSGFTLIEIMLVIVIIGIIVGIAVPKITGKVGKANNVAAQASLKALEAAIQSYEMDNLVLPSGLSDLTVQKNNNGPYVKPSELNDPWGNPFVYAKPGSHGIGFDLSCKSPEGKEFNNWE
ncbi:MAG: type II secretion system protein GspG [Kiritimatiellales bacterium]